MWNYILFTICVTALPIWIAYGTYTDRRNARIQAYQDHAVRTINLALHNIVQLNRMTDPTAVCIPMSDGIFTMLLSEVKTLCGELHSKIQYLNRHMPSVLQRTAHKLSVSVVYDGTPLANKYCDEKFYNTYNPPCWLQLDSMAGLYVPKNQSSYDETIYSDSSGNNRITIIIKTDLHENKFNIHCHTIEDLHIYLRIIQTTYAALNSHPYPH